MESGPSTVAQSDGRRMAIPAALLRWLISPRRSAREFCASSTRWRRSSQSWSAGRCRGSQRKSIASASSGRKCSRTPVQLQSNRAGSARECSYSPPALIPASFASGPALHCSLRFAVIRQHSLRLGVWLLQQRVQVVLNCRLTIRHHHTRSVCGRRYDI